MHPRPDKILICVNRRFEAGIQERRIDIAFDRFICFGQCNKGPTVKLVPGDFILGTRLDMVDGILDDLQAAGGVRDVSDEPPLHLLGS